MNNSYSIPAYFVYLFMLFFCLSLQVCVYECVGLYTFFNAFCLLILVCILFDLFHFAVIDINDLSKLLISMSDMV